MIPFCDNGTSLSQPWLKDGLTPCFFTTVTSSILAGLMLVCGVAEVYVYRKYANRVENDRITKSVLFKVQLLLTAAIAIEPVIYLALQGTVIGDHHLHGYQVLGACLGVLSWIMVFVIVYLECRWMLPSIPTRGHGLVLLLFLTLAFATENLAFLSWFSPLWWWRKDRK